MIVGYTWGLSFPIIKKIWTGSYVLAAGGWSLLLLALFYWIIDVKGYKKWAFLFIVIGMNAITIYFLQCFVEFDVISKFFFEGVAEFSGAAKAVVLAMGVLVVKWLFLLFLYHHKIFFKV